MKTDLLAAAAERSAARAAHLSSDRNLLRLLQDGRADERIFSGALSMPGLSIIAEMKQASPSRGSIRPIDAPGDLARAMEGAGAAALSVLTEPEWFHGSIERLEAVRTETRLPILRKDFLMHPIQLAESAAAGADAVLLIAALVGESLAELVETTRRLGMEPLVEVHAQEDVELALAADARIIGINNRNLSDLSVDTSRADDLFHILPDDVVRVAESGYATPGDMRHLRAIGFDAVLIGSALMEAADPAAALQELARAAAG